ncbi:hypothetical protein Z950_1808 [Sulfitobacter mediterraneus KCTC 32188]|nr:hypothetical protein Z950_1808 [Sulfitobacter mediterraneus KCTC 32188]
MFGIWMFIFWNIGVWYGRFAQGPMDTGRFRVGSEPKPVS